MIASAGPRASRTYSLAPSKSCFGPYADGSIQALARITTIATAVAGRRCRSFSARRLRTKMPRTAINTANPAAKKKKRGQRLCLVANSTAAVSKGGSTITAPVTLLPRT